MHCACKTGTAKWSYDGICTEPEVFGALMNLGGPPTFKMKKFTLEEFEKCLGSITASVRCESHHYLSPCKPTMMHDGTGMINCTSQARRSLYAGQNHANSSSVGHTASISL